MSNEVIVLPDSECPLCKRFGEPKPRLVAEDLKTGKKYVLSERLSERLKDMLAEHVNSLATSKKPRKRKRP